MVKTINRRRVAPVSSTDNEGVTLGEDSEHSNYDEEADISGTWQEMHEVDRGIVDKLKDVSMHEGTALSLEERTSWEDSELFQNEEHTYLVSSENLAQQVLLHGDEAVIIDHLYYDVSKEAEEKVTFNAFSYIEDIFVNLLLPVSCIYVYYRYGYWGLQMRGMAPPSSPSKDSKDDYHHHHDPEEPKWAPPGFLFFLGSTITIILRAVLLTSFFMGGYATLKTGDGIARAPFYHFCFALLVHAFFTVTLSMKKAFRKKSSMARLYLHRERRSEEIFFGWLPLPWNVALFQIRLASYLVGNIAIEKEYLVFDCASVDEMRAAIGKNILHIVDRGGLQAIRPNEVEVVDEKTGEKTFVVRPGSQVSMLAFLLRLTLDNSYASPPFGTPADSLYMDKFSSRTWSFFIIYLQLLPYIVDNTVRNGGSYNSWSIPLIIMSALIVYFNGDAPPQGWTYAAVLTLSRKREMLSFLNSLLTDRLSEGTGKGLPRINESQRMEWAHLLDLSRVSNLSRWHTMREIVMRFDSGYRSRTDGNGAVIMVYIAAFTLALLIGTVLIDGKLAWSEYAYPFLMHISLLLPMGWFAATMCLEGDSCNEVADQSKLALTLGMVQLEEREEKGTLSSEQADRIPAARFAATQLQEALSAGARLNSVQMLQVIDLNRTLVISIIFAVITQITLLLENIDFTS